MFKKLTDFGYQRTTKEAIGFYLAYLLMVMVVAGVLAAILGVIVQSNDTFNLGVKIGTTVAIIASLGISFWILKEKKLLSNFGLILLAVFIGGIGGLIPAAYLTTRPAANSDSENAAH
ncbi:MAG TPA: hypothetical protein PLJ40_00930 [Paludibacteraceae bacterium]|nr:hypothetical protein [Paludibacteraceae bacterium]HQB68753.1 hypothetical protein [Paludibacteraceae bacterium]